MVLSKIIVDLTIMLSDEYNEAYERYKKVNEIPDCIDVSTLVSIRNKALPGELECEKCEQDLRNFLNSLNEDVLYYLIGLMRLGEINDFLSEPDPMERLRLSTEYCIKNDTHPASQMAGKNTLGQFLRKGKEIIGW